MSAAEAVEKNPAEAEAQPAPKRKLLPIILIAVAVIASAGGGAFYFATRGSPAAGSGDAQGTTAAEHGGDAKEGGHGAASGTAQYLLLQPAFVVNLADEEAARFLQIEMEVMARDGKALDEVKNHMPRIRNSVLLLLGSRRAEDLFTREQKEKLQADVLADIQKVMTAETGKPQIEAVFFDSFVMQ